MCHMLGIQILDILSGPDALMMKPRTAPPWHWCVHLHLVPVRWLKTGLVCQNTYGEAGSESVHIVVSEETGEAGMPITVVGSASSFGIFWQPFGTLGSEGWLVSSWEMFSLVFEFKDYIICGNQDFPQRGSPGCILLWLGLHF